MSTMDLMKCGSAMKLLCSDGHKVLCFGHVMLCSDCNIPFCRDHGSKGAFAVFAGDMEKWTKLSIHFAKDVIQKLARLVINN